MSVEFDYNDFLKFTLEIASNDPDRKIDHDGGWQSCAVGDYLKYEFGLSECELERIYVTGLVQDHFDVACLAEPSVPEIIKDLNNCCYETYGELAKAIVQNHPSFG